MRNFNRLNEAQQRAIVQDLARQKGNGKMLPMLITELHRTAAGGGGRKVGGGGRSLFSADKAWLCSVFSNDGLGACDKVVKARDKFFAAVGMALCLGGDTHLTAMEPAVVQAAVLPDLGASFFAIVAEALAEQQALERSAAEVATEAKDAGVFVFGDHQDFVGGVQGMIGYPKGRNEQQWIENMEMEHCEVDPDNMASTIWGGSDLQWTTSNYGLTTSPRQEWHWTWLLEWEGQRAHETVGGYEKEGGVFTDRESTRLRRQAISIDSLNADAPRLIHEMLTELAMQQGRPAFADANGDGTLDEKDQLSLREIEESYERLRVNKAELLALRLYTGPLFEFCANPHVIFLIRILRNFSCDVQLLFFVGL